MEPRPSSWGFDGDVASDTTLGDDSVVENPLGESSAKKNFGVLEGVGLGVMYGVIENWCMTCFDPVKKNFLHFIRNKQDIQVSTVEHL